MSDDRFDRQIRLFGKEGQARIAATRVAVVGIGGLGSHVVQQLSLLGVGHLALIDSEELDETNLNRLIGARHDDPIPGTPKVAIGERAARAINPGIEIVKVHDSLVSGAAFDAILRAHYVFGCLDSDGGRLVLNELSAAYALPYFDLASDVYPGAPPTYGGRVCVAWDGKGCIVCLGLLDIAEAQADLLNQGARRNRDAIYGVQPEALDHRGPSVVSINGVIASLGVTEFMAAVTGLRVPKTLITYYGHMGRIAYSAQGDNGSANDCYYCQGIRGRGDRLDMQRYVREGVGSFLR